jgi:quinohemoprotein ethanol dehydrogenase
MKKVAVKVCAVSAMVAALAFSVQGTAKEPAGSVNWPAVHGNADENAYSPLKQIDTSNVGHLGLDWFLDLPGEVTLEAPPIEVDGTIYFPGSFSKVYAVDALSGKILWSYDPQTWKHNPGKMFYTFGANRGVAYEKGRIFVASLDGRLISLDAKTGKELWVQETIPPGMLNISTGAPRIMNGKVIIGNGGADFGSRGYVTAYDTATGKQLWRFYLAPGSPEQNKGDPIQEMAAKTWTGEWWKTGTGGTAWNSMTFDAETNRVYVGAGNAGPYDVTVRSPGGGDNLFTSSIVALDATTGKYIWHYQETPRDAWDYKATPNIVMATIPVDGKPRKVLLHAPTNGFFYVIDRATGKVLSAEKCVKVNWAKGIDLKTGRPIEEPGIRYEHNDFKIWPGSIGGHNWQPMSYDPQTGLVYIPVQQIGTSFSRGVQADNAFNVMGLMVGPIAEVDGDGKGQLIAWDPVTQKQRWKVQNEQLWNSGALSTAGDLVFQGTADGWLYGYNARTGERVWKFNAGLGIVAAPISYSINGKQYVSVLVGYGGTTAAFGDFMNVGWKYGAQPRRLLTFALDGNKPLPASAPPDMKVHAVDDPKLVLNEADVAAGRQLFVRCAACHGVGLQSTGTPGPDLRESGIALDPEALKDVLKNGRLLENGMPRFDMLSDKEISQLHAYIRAGAREALGLRPKSKVKPPPVNL